MLGFFWVGLGVVFALVPTVALWRQVVVQSEEIHRIVKDQFHVVTKSFIIYCCSISNTATVSPL